MKNGTGLLPMTATAAQQLVNAEDGEVAKVKYLAGFPRSYRFDASRGFFSVNGMMPISKKDQPVTIIPIGYRIFKADILGITGKQWAEFFFLNENNQLCNLLVHGYSVDNLMDSTKELFYEDVNLCGVALTIQPIEKTSKQKDENGKYPKYYIGKFTYQLLDEVARENSKAAVEGMSIWRTDTLTEEVETQVSVNYNPPVVVKEVEAATTETPEANTVTLATKNAPTNSKSKGRRKATKKQAVGACV